MSHVVVYVGIPSHKLKGDFSKENVEKVIEEIVSPYVEATAKEDMMQLDWYVIGGRWAGIAGAEKDAEHVYPSENGEFAYEFIPQYNVVVNRGASGPYVAGVAEYFPVNGGVKKNIAWDSVAKLNDYFLYKYMMLVLERDEMLGGNIPEGLEIVDDALYLMNEEHTLLVKKGETYEERCKREDRKYQIALLPPDAYIDLAGNWHDENDVWEDSKRMKEIYKAEDVLAGATDAFVDQFYDFFENELQPDDYFIVLDGHKFP